MAKLGLMLMLTGATLLDGGEDSIRRLRELLHADHDEDALSLVNELIRSPDFWDRPPKEKAFVENVYGHLLYRRGNLKQAERVFARLGAFCQEASLGVACSLAAANSLLALYLESGQTRNAERILRAAGQMVAYLDATHPEALRFAGGRCVLAVAQQHLQEAESWCRQTLGGWEQTGMQDSLDAASVRNNLGLIYLRQRRFADAVAMLDSGVSLMRRHTASARSRLPVPLANLASAMGEMGRLAESEQLHRDSVAVAETALGPTHPITAQVMMQFSVFLTKHNRKKEARRLRGRASRILQSVPNEPGWRDTVDARTFRR